MERLYDEARYPEGPAQVGETLYFVEYARDAIRALSLAGAPTVRTVWREAGLGPAAVVRGPDGLLWATGYDGGCVLAVTPDGAVAERLAADDRGGRLEGPNDLVFDARGGLYFTASGVFDVEAPVAGAVYHRPPGEAARRVADGIHYANGLALSPDGGTLYVAEHFRNRVLAFRVAPGGALGEPRVHAVLAAVAPPPRVAGWARAPDLGPDGMKTDGAGRLWIAQYGGGRIVVLTPSGTLERVYEAPLRFTTNLTFAPREAALYVTAFAESAPPYRGAVLTRPLP